MLIQSIRMALQAITGNKMRSFLTMLGIIIGVMALTVMVSLVSGATGSVTSEIESLGSNQISAYIFDDKGKPITIDDLEKLAESDEIAEVAPLMQTSGNAKHGYKDASISIYGVNPAYQRIVNAKVHYGRYLRTTDVDNSTHVAVLSEETAKKLFDRVDVVGNHFTIDGRRFLVVGVLEKVNSTMSFFGFSYDVYVPYSVVQRITGTNGITSIYATSSDPASNDAAEAYVTEFLKNRLKGDTDAFYLQNMSAIMDSMSQVTSTMTLLLGGIAAISLLVGGIGIMNIMLVSVTERTREIGIRKAIGAGGGSIMLQFLIEALVVSLCGCIIGLLLSQGILQIVTMVAAANTTTTMNFSMSPSVVALAVGFSSGIGLIFGLYPARKAAKMHPIEALRYQG